MLGAEDYIASGYLPFEAVIVINTFVIMCAIVYQKNIHPVIDGIGSIDKIFDVDYQ